MTWQPDICVYHAHCDDGFGAAWAIGAAVLGTWVMERWAK